MFNMDPENTLDMQFAGESGEDFSITRARASKKTKHCLDLPIPLRRSKRQRVTKVTEIYPQSSSDEDDVIEEQEQQRVKRPRAPCTPKRREMNLHLRLIARTLNASMINLKETLPLFPSKILVRANIIVKKYEIWRFFFKEFGRIVSSHYHSMKPEAVSEGGGEASANGIDWTWSGWLMNPNRPDPDDVKLGDSNEEFGQDRISYTSKFTFVEESGGGDDEEGEEEITVLKRVGYRQFTIPKELEIEGKPSYAPEVITFVGMVFLQVDVDLLKVTETCGTCEYGGDLKPLIMHLREPKCTGHLYSNGRLILMGTKTQEELRTAFRKLARMVQKAGHDVKLSKIRQRFCIGFTKLPFRVSLEAMAKHEKLVPFINYDPEHVPAALLKVNQTNAVCIVSANGTILISEVSNAQALKKTLDLIYPCLRSFGYSKVGFEPK